MCYNKIIDTYYNNQIIRCGVVNGNDSVLLIKVGQNGSLEGYQGKYVRIANYIHDKHGITVVVSENPYDRTDSLQGALDVIKAECGTDAKIYYMGISNGAILGARYAYNHSEIQRMLLINGPLMINWPQSSKGVTKFMGDKVIFAYGDKDPSYGYVPIIDSIQTSCDIVVRTIPGANHHFAGMEDSVIELIEEELLVDSDNRKYDE